MIECVNLMRAFGRRYKIGFDPAYDAKGRRRTKLDPWYMVIPCLRGTIYPYGGRSLAVEVEGRPITINRLRQLDGLTCFQDGDAFAAFTFDMALFPQVAAIVRPRRRRQVSERQRTLARERMRQRHSPIPVPEHSQHAPMLAAVQG